MHIIENECPICFEFLDNSNDYIILKCCKKNVHISCLNSWYNKNNINNNLSCFLCTQKNNDINNILINDNILSDNKLFFIKIFDCITYFCIFIIISFFIYIITMK